MTDMEKIDLLEQKMMMFNHHDPMRIQHLMKVHRFAQMIGRMEKLDNQSLWDRHFLDLNGGWTGQFTVRIKVDFGRFLSL